jgi:glycosyltransferase involved in cell wall biosynthesis
MRIVQVLAGLGAGGAERLVLHLSRWLQIQGHHVEVVNIYTDTTLQPEFEAAGVCVRHMRMTPYVSQWYPGALVSYVRRFQLDVVHCHDTAWRKCARACRIAQIPCVWTLHGYLKEWLENGKWWMRRSARDTAFLVGVEPNVEQLIRETLQVDGAKVLHVVNGVPGAFVSNNGEVEWGVPVPSGARVVGMVSRLSRVKDPQTLIRAIHVVRQVVPDVHLVLVGRGELEEEIRCMIHQEQLEDCVHLLGYRQDIPHLLQAMDVFVLSSHSEGLSLAILEAMSAQRPIVATAVGGTPALLANGECGLLVPPGDVQAMAQAITELLTNKTKAEELARRARERFLQEYTIDRTGERYLELYEKAMAQHREKT